MRRALLVLGFVVLPALPASAQSAARCRMLCPHEFNVEPTISIDNVFARPRIADAQGTIARERREAELEVIFSFGLPTRVAWLEFTAEASVVPFDREATPELEFEANFTWLPSDRTRAMQR